MFKKIFGYTEKFATWLSLIWGVTLMGGAAWVSNYLAVKTPWIVKAGPYGIWFATLIGAFAVMIIYGGFIKATSWRLSEKTRAKWLDRTHSVNPLDATFYKQKIILPDLVDPIRQKIKGKRFTECQLVGPVNFIIGKNVSLSHNSLVNCDFIPARQDAFIYNAVMLEDTTITSCDLFKCTFFVSPAMHKYLSDQGFRYIGLTGDPALDKIDPARPQGRSI